MAAHQCRREEAWAAFSRFAHDGFTSPPADSQWLFAVAALAETCALLDEGAWAAALFNCSCPSPSGWWLLAAALGRHAEAEARFAAAAEAAARFDAAPWVTRAQAARERLVVGNVV